MRRRHRAGSLLAACAIALSGTGCDTGDPAAGSLAGDVPVGVYELDGAAYATAFDEVVALLQDEGFAVAVRDRDGGVVESRPAIAGSLIEPWNWPGGDLGAALENTASFQRRRIRFEFLPVGFRPAPPTDEAALIGPRVPGSVDPAGERAIDLAGHDGPIELRVWVYVERAFTPHLQRSTWTLTRTTFASDPLASRAAGDGTTRDRSIWTPIGRDEAMERIQLAKVRERLEP
jgi:hypothetical protein